MTARPSSRDGFTLIEVVAALVIFAAGVLVAVELSDALAAQANRATIRSEVVTVAQEKVEEIRSTRYASVSTGTTEESLTIAGRSYIRTTVISDFGNRIYSVDVTVAPRDASATLPSHALITYVYGSW